MKRITRDGAHERMSTDGRYEIKFVAQPHDLSLIGLVSRLNLAGFREVFEPREVHNFYFDTLRLSSYYENLAGTGPREKIRFRWYVRHQIYSWESFFVFLWNATR